MPSYNTKKKNYNKSSHIYIDVIHIYIYKYIFTKILVKYYEWVWDTHGSLSSNASEYVKLLSNYFYVAQICKYVCISLKYLYQNNCEYSLNF